MRHAFDRETTMKPPNQDVQKSAFVGRPSTYTRAKADAVLELIEDGRSVRAACRKTGLSKTTFLRWVASDLDGLTDRYSRAREAQILFLIDEGLDIADDASQDWLASRIADGTVRFVPNHEHLKRVAYQLAYRKRMYGQYVADSR
jgi:Helix-turn-helix domain of resolvase